MDNWETVYSYSRKQAIEDGVLIDITEAAKESGFVLPVAVTASVYHGLIVPSNRAETEYGQSVEGRLHDMLFLLQYAIRITSGKSQLLFDVAFLMENESGEIGDREVKLKAVIDGGDDGSPVVTIMGEEED
ncbi:hypothetical protein K7I13_03595 [Brucepastera parasyntrophica]|uniref:DUF6573 family protein n=1 Tax=Brucepastera parasyntrophica TaxID=2880008 RepID=UPI002109A836|nr:DUF6573 family protein [Brucepastera parasyntrophica]ULQ60404.1 hypothetical protein K7I13_03595 [Brucepastera parasyntrophica]